MRYRDLRPDDFQHWVELRDGLIWLEERLRPPERTVDLLWWQLFVAFENTEFHGEGERSIAFRVYNYVLAAYRDHKSRGTAEFDTSATGGF